MRSDEAKCDVNVRMASLVWLKALLGVGDALSIYLQYDDRLLLSMVARRAKRNAINYVKKLRFRCSCCSPLDNEVLKKFRAQFVLFCALRICMYVCACCVQRSCKKRFLYSLIWT